MLPETHYLGLDQAPRRIGWALGNPEMSAPLSGVFVMPSVGESTGLMLRMASEWLQSTIAVYHVSHVCFESPFVAGMKSQATLRSMFALAGAIELVCARAGVNCREVTPFVWRRRFIGTDRAPKQIIGSARRRQWLKDQAMHACVARAWDVRTDDEAEACGILDYVLACDFPKYGSAAGAKLLEVL